MIAELVRLRPVGVFLKGVLLNLLNDPGILEYKAVPEGFLYYQVLLPMSLKSA